MTKHLKGTLLTTFGFAFLMVLVQTLLRHKTIREALIQSVLTALVFGVLLYFLNRKKE